VDNQGRATLVPGVACDECGENVYRLLEGHCLPCWRQLVRGVQTRRCGDLCVDSDPLACDGCPAAIRHANDDYRGQLRAQAEEMVGGTKDVRFEEIVCHHCQNGATLMAVGNGGAKPQAKVLCAGCKTTWV